MTDWVLTHTQLTLPHSTQVQVTHLCPSPEHPRTCWKSLFCFLDSCNGTSHCTRPWYLWRKTCTCSCWSLSIPWQWGRQGQNLLLKVVPPVRTLATHWPQWSGETESAWKQKNTSGTGYVSVRSSQTRWVHHPRHRQTSGIRLLNHLTTSESHRWMYQTQEAQ